MPAVLAAAEQHAQAGRWVAGFVSYDAAPGFDPALAVSAGPPVLAAPLAWFGVFDAPAPEGAPPARNDGCDEPAWTPHATREHHARAVAAIHDAIGDGAVYQVNHTLRLRSPWRGDPLALYERLRAAQERGYAAYVRADATHVLSASPELFFVRTGNRVTCRPMKGTARRGRWLEEDEWAAAALRGSLKERAENVMIVDLLRNDLGRVAVTGSVEVPRLFEVERYPTVLQLTSTVTALLRPGVTLPDLFAALFPCGSVTGAPKVAATRWIAQLEEAPRGVYCGAIGLLEPGGDCTFNVAIRTVVVDERAGLAEYGVGGGITIDSSAEGEHDELLAKAAVLTHMRPDFRLLETLRLEDGRFARPERHLARLCASARYFGFAAPEGSAGDALASLARAYPRGLFRVRLLAARDGGVEAGATPFADDATPGPRPVALARTAVSSNDPFLFHKTTYRRAYDDRRRERPDVWEVLLWNERGELTEFTIGNLVVELDGVRWTPARTSGLLAGAWRAELLERGEIRERVVRREELGRTTRLWLVNSLRGWVPVRLAEGPA